MENMSWQHVLEFFDKFQGMIQEEVDRKIKTLPEDPYHSPETKEINAALAIAQGEFPSVKHNRENPWYKKLYSDLDIIMISLRPILSKHGLSLTQQERLCDGATVLYTRLWHSSGQWIETRNRIVTKNDEHSYGSALAFYKRTSLMTLLGITMADDPYDDDAEVAMHELRKEKAKGTALNTKYNPRENTSEVITKEQLDELNYELSEYPDITEDILEAFKIRSIGDIPKSKYHNAMIRIREIKNLRNGLK